MMATNTPRLSTGTSAYASRAPPLTAISFPIPPCVLHDPVAVVAAAAPVVEALARPLGRGGGRGMGRWGGSGGLGSAASEPLRARRPASSSADAYYARVPQSRGAQADDEAASLSPAASVVASSSSPSSFSSLRPPASYSKPVAAAGFLDLGGPVTRAEYYDNDFALRNNVTIVRTREEAQRVVKAIRSAAPGTIFACDTEVADINLKEQGPVGNGYVTCVSVYGGPEVDFGDGRGKVLWVDNLDDARGVLQEFKAWFEDPTQLKVWHNYGFDRHVLYNEGIDAMGFAGDTMHMARLEDSSREKATGEGGGYSLEALTHDLLNRRKVPMKELFGMGKPRKDGTESKVKVVPPVEELQRGTANPQHRRDWIRYSAYDAEGTRLLYFRLASRLASKPWKSGKSMFDFYQRYIVPFGEILTDMERRGVHVEASTYLRSLEERARADKKKCLEDFRQWAVKVAGADAALFNPQSSLQMQTLFFGGCKNPKTGEVAIPNERVVKVQLSEEEAAELEEFERRLAEAEKKAQALWNEAREAEAAAAVAARTGEDEGEGVGGRRGGEEEPGEEARPQVGSPLLAQLGLTSLEDLGTLKVAQLKELCRGCNLKLSGKKAELRQRLEEHIAAAPPSSAAPHAAEASSSPPPPPPPPELQQRQPAASTTAPTQATSTKELPLMAPAAPPLSAASASASPSGAQRSPTPPGTEPQHGAHDGDEGSVTIYDSMSPAQLAGALRARGLPSTGTREEMVNRILNDDDYAMRLLNAKGSPFYSPRTPSAPAAGPGPGPGPGPASASSGTPPAPQPPASLGLAGEAETVAVPQRHASEARQPRPLPAPPMAASLPPRRSTEAVSARSLLDPDYVKAMDLKYQGVSGKPGGKRYRDITIRSIGMTPTKFTPSGQPSVTMDVLRALAGQQTFDGVLDESNLGLAYDFFQGGEPGLQACRALDALCRMGSIDTMLSTFIEPLQKLADAESRVHCSMNLNTETGRLSSRRPNLQNQPALEKDHYKIREAFSAPEGKMLIVADYGQLELRLLAHMANCRSMIEAFESGGCFHSRTAVGMFEHVRRAVESGEVLLEWDSSNGKAPKPLVKDMFGSERRKAKTLNFSIAYGKTPHGLSKDWGVSVAEANDLLQKWYADRPEVKAWQDHTIKEARRTGETRTLMGRYRKLADINARNRAARGHSERAAINTPIQGGAADVVMMAMISISRSRKLEDLGYKLLLQIHDEVILEGPEENVEEALAEVKYLMENPWDEDSLGLSKLSVHLDVDAKYAKTWYQAK